MDNGDNFNKFICIILDCINEDDLIFSYSNSKFYFKKLNAGDDLYSTFNDKEYRRTKDILNTVIDNLLKYQKYFNIQSLPEYKIKDTENKIDLQITIPNIFKCIQESFDVENWYYDRMRNRKEEMNKRYVNYPSKGIINNKELMNRTFFGGDPSDDSIIENDIILNTRYYSSYDLLLVHVLINFCYILNDGYYLSLNILTMFLLSKIHYLIGKYYVINCNYYKTIKMLDQKTLDLFLVNDKTDNYLTYYQKELLQLFNYKFKNTLVDDFNSRILIIYVQISYIPIIINLYYNNYNKQIIDHYLDVIRVIKDIIYLYDDLLTKADIYINDILYALLNNSYTSLQNDINKLVNINNKYKPYCDNIFNNKTTIKACLPDLYHIFNIYSMDNDTFKPIAKLLHVYVNNDEQIKYDTLIDVKKIIEEYINHTKIDKNKKSDLNKLNKLIDNITVDNIYTHIFEKCYGLNNLYSLNVNDKQFQSIIKSFKDFLIDNNYVISVGSIDTLFNKLQNDPFTNPIKLDEYKFLQKGNLMFMSAVFKTIEKNLRAKYYYPIKFKSNVPRYTPYPVIPTKIANIKELFEKYDINHLMNQHIINQFFKVNTLKQIPKFKLLTKSGGSSDINIYHQMLLNIVNKLKLKNISINEHDITAFNNKLNKIETIKNELQELVNQVLITNDKDKINDYNNKLTEYNKENHNIIKFLNQLNKFI